MAVTVFPDALTASLSSSEMSLMRGRVETRNPECVNAKDFIFRKMQILLAKVSDTSRQSAHGQLTEIHCRPAARPSETLPIRGEVRRALGVQHHLPRPVPGVGDQP